MSLQTWSMVVLVIGIVLTALGTYGSYHFGKIEAEKKEREFTARQANLQAEISILRANTESINKQLDLIVKSTEIKQYEWREAKVLAPAIADYIYLIFKSSAGKISGNVRVKGTKEIYPFSTLVNDKTPLAIHNLWLPEKNQYQTDPFIEYEITEMSDEKDSLSIFSTGYKLSF